MVGDALCLFVLFSFRNDYYVVKHTDRSFDFLPRSHKPWQARKEASRRRAEEAPGPLKYFCTCEGVGEKEDTNIFNTDVLNGS